MARRPPPPFMANAILNFHFDYWNHSLMFSQHAENTCGCRPWHVPSEDGAKMCFVVGNVCFNQASSCSCFQDDFLVLDFVLLSYQFVDNCLHRPLKMILYTQVMEKIRAKKIFPTCSCKSDCVG